MSERKPARIEARHRLQWEANTSEKREIRKGRKPEQLHRQVSAPDMTNSLRSICARYTEMERLHYEGRKQAGSHRGNPARRSRDRKD